MKFTVHLYGFISGEVVYHILVSMDSISETRLNFAFMLFV